MEQGDEVVRWSKDAPSQLMVITVEVVEDLSYDLPQQIPETSEPDRTSLSF
jgi:hypothetical protein